jgi:hypothetical protein
MPSLFEIGGDNLDQGYLNLREGQFAEREIRDTLERMWVSYEQYADSDFRDGFARDPDGRFWEMYLGCTLLEAGKVLLPAAERQRAGGHPDLCVIEDDRRIWIEATAPDRGAPGPDHVVEPLPINEGGDFERAPIRQAQLRITSAFLNKSRVIEQYLQTQVIAPEDARLVAIGGGRFGIHAPENGLPLIMSALFPIGPEFVTIDIETDGVVAQGFEPSFSIERQRGAIPRTAFIEECFSHISGVIWSRASIGNMSRQQRPITFVHNPLATVCMSQNWGVWDREFLTTPHDVGWQARDILARPVPLFPS